MFYRNKILGWTNKDGMDMLESMDTADWGMGMGNSGMFGMGAGSTCGGASGSQGGDVHSMMVDEDYMELMTDTLFSTISSNQPLYFPDPREIARGASLADFIQPSLGPLQPNLDDFIDTLEPLQEFLSARLPPVPEEDVFNGGALGSNYPELDLMAPMNSIGDASAGGASGAAGPMQTDDAASIALQNLQYTARMYTQAQQQQQQQQEAATSVFRNNVAVTESFNALQQSYAQQMQQQQQQQQPSTTQQPIREKQPRQSRISMRNSRLTQQQQQHQQQQTYQAAQQQIAYQTQQQQRTSYPMNIQSSVLVPTTSLQMQLSLVDQTSQHVQNLLNQQQQQQQQQQQSFATVAEPPQQVPKQMKTSLQSKPYNKNASQGYKFPPPVATFDAHQCKFTTNNLKAMQQSAQPVVAVTAQQTVQPRVLLQCKPTGIDLTAPALHPTKLLPRPAQPTIAAPAAKSAEVKEEVFAVPKYQMKVRNRSRSSSSLNAPRMHPPPLVSAVSDPALNINNNVLLAHLLTNNSSNLYTVNTGSDKVTAQTVVGVKHILPMLPSTLSSSAQVTNTTHHITSPITVHSMHNSANVQNKVQQQSLQSGPGQQLLLSTSSQAHQSQNSNPNSPKDGASAHSPQGLSPSPMHSPMSIGSPLSPSRGYIKADPERGQYKEQRRVGHIHAEQKRRYNIKNGFDMLYSLIPQLSQNPNTKMSKAAMLQKGADYISVLRNDRNQLKEEMEKLRCQIDSLNSSISNCQAMLPATGAPVSRQRRNKMKEMFDEYVRTRTRDNWKFWIFSILLEPLMVSFNTSVSTASIEDLYRTTIAWVEQHCSLVDLRPAVLNSLRYLCTATDILNDPSRLPEEALAAVNQSERRNSTQ